MAQRTIRATAAIGIVMATLAAAPHPASAPAAGHGLDFGDGIHLETDQSNYNLNTGIFTMPSHVRFTRPGTDAVGDRAHGNSKTGIVVLSGHVVVHDSGASPEAQQAGGGGGPTTLTCDELQIDTHRKLYVAIGNVHYTQGSRFATADRGQLDQVNHLLDLSGNVHMGDGDQTLSANTLHYNTVTKDVTTSQTQLRLPAAPAAPGTTSTLPKPAAKATAKPK